MVKVSQEIAHYYTDILSHCYEPNGTRICLGTTCGKLAIINRKVDDDEAFCEMEKCFPSDSAVVSTQWDINGCFACNKNALYFFKCENPGDKLKSNETGKYQDQDFYNIMDLSTSDRNKLVFCGCDDNRIRAWDIETETCIVKLDSPKCFVEVLDSNDEYLVSGGQNGNIYVYDAKARSPEPVSVIETDEKTITGLCLSDSSTWIAAGSFGAPIVMNLRNSAGNAPIKVDSANSIYDMKFDSEGSLWWAGSGATLLKSDDLINLSSTLKTSFGDGIIYHIYSIACCNTTNRISAAGSSNSIVFSESSQYWDGIVYI